MAGLAEANRASSPSSESVAGVKTWPLEQCVFVLQPDRRSSSASRTAPQVSLRRGVIVAVAARLVVADAAGGAEVHPAAVGQELAQLAASPLDP
jgi:hypothetical protein